MPWGVVQIEVLPKPPESRPPDQPWPGYPTLLKTSSSHEEGGRRLWSVLTKKFLGENGKLTGLSCVRVEFDAAAEGKTPAMREISDSRFEMEADMAVLAVGFLRPEKTALIEELGIELDNRGMPVTGGNYHTSARGIFSAGDMRRGPSLIVRALAEGRGAARSINDLLRR